MNQRLVKKHLIVWVLVLNIVLMGSIQVNALGTVTRQTVTLSNGTTALKWISGEFSASEKTSGHQWCITNYPGITKVSDATVKYNCHSYAWYSTAPSNIHWINDPVRFRNSSNWIVSTGYTNTIPNNAQNGDKVDYYVNASNRPHSAKVSNKSQNLFVSKWGNYGVYTHRPTNSPYSFNNLGYYR